MSNRSLTVLANPVQRALAARASMLLDIDHHLDARQMRRQRAPVQTTIDGSPMARCRLGAVRFCFAARYALFNIFEREQELIFRQLLGPAAEPMPLQFFDDLFEPLGTRALRQQHGFQRIGIVWERFCRDRHAYSESRAAAESERLQHADSQCRSSTRLHRCRRLDRMHAPPIEPFEQARELCRG
jgi:hypothetical protein